MAVYRTRGLPDGTMGDREFEFIIDDLSGRLRIPGDHHGPDVTIAESPEQERWLNSRRDLLTPYWDCEWWFAGEDARATFIDLIRSVAP